MLSTTWVAAQGLTGCTGQQMPLAATSKKSPVSGLGLLPGALLPDRGCCTHPCEQRMGSVSAVRRQTRPFWDSYWVRHLMKRPDCRLE